MTTSATSPRPRLLPDVLRARAEHDDGRTALVVGDDSLTFGEWDRRSNAIARGLVDRGVAPGDRLALRFDGASWLDYAVTLFATLKAGAVAVPVRADLSPPQVAAVLRHCGATAACRPAGRPPTPGIPTWSPSDLGEAQADERFQVDVDDDALAQVLYTSGTTGSPKGVACTHANLLFGIVTDGAELAAARREHVAVHALPVGVNASQMELVRSAHRLASTVIAPAFEPERFCAMVATHRGTVLLLVPAMAILLVNAGTFDRHDTTSVRRVRLTGDTSPPALLRRLAAALPAAEIVNEYVLTESPPAGVTTVYHPARPRSVGRPGPGRQVRIVGEGGRSCPAGTVGEVWLASPGAPMRSYYGDRGATVARFVGGWLRTGDLGYLDGDGFLHLTDRREDLVVTGGHNVSTADVEAALHECPAVAEAAAVGMPHDVLGEHVVAAVVLRAPVSAVELKAIARGHLPAHAVPQRVVFLERLPRGATGKVSKTQLRARLSAEGRPPSVPPRTPTEAAMAAIWAGVLGTEVDDLSVEEPFSDLGGQSVAALEVVAEVRRRFGVRLEVSDLAGADTVAALAALVDEGVVARA